MVGCEMKGALAPYGLIYHDSLLCVRVCVGWPNLTCVASTLKDTQYERR